MSEAANAPQSPPPPAPPTAKAPEPAPNRPVAPSAVTPAKRTVREQSGSHGSPTFANPHGAIGPGVRIPADALVEVECRVYAPEIANADGWWYRIASGAFDGRYDVANIFMNGDATAQMPATNAICPFRSADPRRETATALPGGQI